jgi:hypothetical protein|tara:strand:- start:3050 stop:4252 length:1203 start_codon:yes stop_codon:yes gene_type:complete
MQIYNLTINKSKLSTAGEVRQFSVEGGVNSEFFLQVASSNSTFYDFKTKTFTSSFGVNNNLKVTLNSVKYVSSITFPSGTNNYNFLLIPDPSSLTTISRNRKSIIETVSQVANTTLSISSATAETSSYKTLPSALTVVDNPGSMKTVDTDLNITVENVETDTNGFGLRLIRQPVDSDFIFETTENVLENPLGDAVSSNRVVVADATGIGVGMTLVFHKGTTAPTAGTVVTAIRDNTLEFNNNVAFENGETMKFKAIGGRAICEATGLTRFQYTNTEAVGNTITRLVRADGSVADEATDGSNAKVAINGTYGLSGGSHVTFTGAGVDNTSTNNINVVTASETEGLFTCDVAQSLTAGTVLTFKGSSQNINIRGTILTVGQPAFDATVSLQLDNFITVGTAS